MAAAPDRGENDVRSADEEETLALTPSTTDTVTTAPSIWPQQRKFPRATTTAMYMYQAPPLSINAGTTLQSSSQERGSMTTQWREDIRVAGLGTTPTPPVSQSPVNVASAMARLRIESSSFRSRVRLIPLPVSSHAENIRAAAATDAHHQTRDLPSQNRDSRERSRGRLDEEYLPRGEGFVRVASNIEHRSTPRWRKRILLPETLGQSSSSESEGPAGHLPASSSWLRVDFQDMSPDSSEISSDRQTSTRRRQVPAKGPRRQSQSTRSTHHRSNEGYQVHSLQVIKTLKSWGIRYSGNEKDSPEQFLSRLKACKRASGIPGKDLLPCLASVLVKDAGEWYEVYQEEMRTWNFRTFEWPLNGGL